MKKLILLIVTMCSILNLYSQETGTFVDERDGKTYRWIKIGEQTWMAENINYKTKKGSWVNLDTKKDTPKITVSDTIYSAEVFTMGYGRKNSKIADIYGRLYNWEMANEVCPAGWHLPSDKEWKQLETYLGMSEDEAENSGQRGTNLAAKIKSDTGWDRVLKLKEGADISPILDKITFVSGKVSSVYSMKFDIIIHDPNFIKNYPEMIETYISLPVTNESGFSALAGGGRWPNIGSLFISIKRYAYFWTSTRKGSRAWDRSLHYSHNKIARDLVNRKRGNSVRCIKDD